MERIDVSIVFLTLNGLSDHFEETLNTVFGQKTKYKYEIIVIDSGSTDGTLDFVKKNQEIKLYEILKSEFGHGKTRQLGVNYAKGDYVVFLTQDATPANEYWLDYLIGNFAAKDVVGVCGKILPRNDASVLKKISVNNDLSGRNEKIIAYIENYDEFKKSDYWKKRLNYYFFNDISSAVRRSFVIENPIPDVFFAEDLEFAKIALGKGKKIVFEPMSVVYHSHEYTIKKTYQRNYIDARYHAIYFDKINAQDLRAVFRNVVHFVKSDLRLLPKYNLMTHEKITAILYSPIIHFVEQYAQYVGGKNEKIS